MAKGWLGLAIAFAAISAVGTTILALSPRTQSFDCDRRRCRLSPQYAIGSPIDFPLPQVRELRLVGDGHPAIATVADGRPSYWTAEAPDEATAEGYRRAVDALHAFVDGTAPALHVEFPTSHAHMLRSLLLGAAFLVGGFLAVAWRQGRGRA